MKNTVSVKRVIAEIQNSFEFTGTAWIPKALDHIGGAMRIIKCTLPLEPKKVTVSASEFRLVLPCDFDSLLFIVYCNYILPIKNHNLYFSKCTDTNLDTHPVHFAIANPAYIRTSFETGDVDIHYYAYPEDEDGLPLLPDSQIYIEAVSWFVAYKLMLSGMKHVALTRWQEAYEMWERLYPRAQNDVNSVSFDELETIITNYNRIVKSPSILESFTQE